VEEYFHAFYENLKKEASTLGALDVTETYKTLYWVSEVSSSLPWYFLFYQRERVQGVTSDSEIEAKQVEIVGPVLLGLYKKKGFDSLLARWKLASGYTHFLFTSDFQGSSDYLVEEQ
jgi:hypothetical protein